MYTTERVIAEETGCLLHLLTYFAFKTVVFKPQCFSGIGSIQRLILLMGGVKKISVQNVGNWDWQDLLSRLSKQIHINWHMILCLPSLRVCYHRVIPRFCYCTIVWMWTLFTLWSLPVSKSKSLKMLSFPIPCCTGKESVELPSAVQLLRVLWNKDLNCILMQHVLH